jgi:hypothetical protein
VYQKYTGPTYPKRLDVTVNDKQYKLKLVRSLALDENSEVKLKITDPSVKAKLYFKRYRSNDEYKVADFVYIAEPKKEGYSAVVPQQPAAGKLQYYVEISDSKETKTYLKETPVVIRYKGGVPAYILIPHILCMFIAMDTYPVYCRRFHPWPSCTKLCLRRIMDRDTLWMGSY